MKNYIEYGADAFRNIFEDRGLFLALSIIFTFGLMIIPLPNIFVDLSLAVSLAVSIAILLTAIFIDLPVNFSMLPTLLLLTSLLRLSINVAIARIIFENNTMDPYAAGALVAGFFSLLAGDDVVVGAALFSIIFCVNILVVTRGASRVAEVSARFHLDSMPGKQMAIDAEVSAGLVSEPIAKVRRERIEEESGFFGAMDGATKFVRGDAACAVIIVLVNAVGGLAIGVLRYNMSMSLAFNHYVALAIGEGLTSQIPALIISAATGIVVSKGSNKMGVNNSVLKGISVGSRPFLLVSIAMALLGSLPKMPMVPFSLVSLISIAIALRIRLQSNAEVGNYPGHLASDTQEVVRLDHDEQTSIQLGVGLISIVGDNAQQLPEMIKRLRHKIFQDLGIEIPPIRISDTSSLAPNLYAISIKGFIVGSGELHPMKVLAIDPNFALKDMGIKYINDPAFGIPACWVEESLLPKMIETEITIVNAATVLITHLNEIIRDNAADFLTYAGTEKLIGNLQNDQKKLAAEIVPAVYNMSTIHRVLESLLMENVSLKDIGAILEGIQTASGLAIKSAAGIAAIIRIRLSRQICDSHCGIDGYISAILLSSNWESIFSAAQMVQSEDASFALQEDLVLEFVAALRSVSGIINTNGDRPVLLTSGKVRPHLFAIIDRIKIKMSVMSHSEIHRRAKVKILQTI